MINTETYSSLPERLSRWLLLSCLMAVGIGQSFIFTSLPPIGREIGLADVRISTLITAGAATFVVAAFLWGGIINRIGRVRSVIIGMGSYAVTIASTGFVLQEALANNLTPEQTYYCVFALRIIFSLGIAGILPSIQTYLISHTDIKHRSSTIAMIGAAFSIGMILGPAFASLLSGLGLTAPFYIISFLAGSAALLVVFFAIVAVIHDQHLFKPVIDYVLAMDPGIQPTMFFIANGVLSMISDNVFVATVYINEVRAALDAGTISRGQFDLLTIAINTGTNIPSVATPNGQAAFLFLLTSAVAPLVNLSYGRMVVMALPYTITMSITAITAVNLFL